MVCQRRTRWILEQEVRLFQKNQWTLHISSLERYLVSLIFL